MDVYGVSDSSHEWTIWVSIWLQINITNNLMVIYNDLENVYNNKIEQKLI